MKKTLIIGVGSVLRGDDGLGICVIDELEKQHIPEGISLQCGDIFGLDLLKFFSDFARVIIVDAADMKEEPGTIKVFERTEIKNSYFKNEVSTHGITLLETLTLADKLDIPSEITIVGVQPKDTSFRLGLTDLIEKRLPAIISKVKGLFLCFDGEGQKHGNKTNIKGTG